MLLATNTSWNVHDLCSTFAWKHVEQFYSQKKKGKKKKKKKVNPDFKATV